MGTTIILKEIEFPNMVLFANSFLVFLRSYFLHVFSFISRYPLSTSISSKFDDHIDKNENEDMGFDLDEKKEMPKLRKSSKYEFICGESLCGFVEDHQTMSFSVQEMFVTSSFDDDVLFSDENGDSSSSSYDDCGEFDGEIFAKQGETEGSVSGLDFGELVEESEIFNVKESVVIEEELSYETRSSVSDSNEFWASIHQFDDFFVSDCVLDCDSPRSLVDNSTHLSSFDVESEEEDVDFRYIEIEPQSGKSRTNLIEHVSRNEFSDSDEECGEEDDENEMDVLLEQKELIRQMKKEMRHLKMSGLPTILEECESPRVEDDLRPLKIDLKIGHKDFMDEIQILYKKYLDKMKRLDILSQQTMYAIGLHQLKHQGSKNVSTPLIKSGLLTQSLWSYNLEVLRKHEDDPIEKLIRDFQRDLELAYVSQLCISWEILKWQHHKSNELHANDPDGFRQHNQVAGEFQKFQVLLQRFTEDEPFHPGPRIQHFVKSRCSLPNLLQVPLIKDDPRGDWKGKAGEGGVSIGMLKEVIGASMRAFWEFLNADKDEFHALTLLGFQGSVDVHLQESSDVELLVDVRSKLHKKERRLKDLVKSGNCLVRKFQKHQNQRLSHEMFLAQVELRLVSRVLNMPRLTTDQLLWCHKKLNKINIVGRKVYLDTSFLLFPC